MSEKKETIVLIVDDEKFFLKKISDTVQALGYPCLTSDNADSALNNLRDNNVDIVLSDVVMPERSGIELLQRIKEIYPMTPVVLMSGRADMEITIQALNHGAFHFISKSEDIEIANALTKATAFNRSISDEVEHRLGLERKLSEQDTRIKDSMVMVQDLTVELVQRLTKMAEYRDSTTGTHNARLGHYSTVLAEAAGLSEEFIISISFASPMHDIGKVAIPDKILLKNGRLTEEEMDIIKSHTVTGHSILRGSTHPSIEMAANVALSHHERFDGTGYPYGIKGEEILIEGRIVSICDVYDSLRSERPYKQPYSHEQACDILMNGNERTRPEHFDQELLKTFRKVSRNFDEIYTSLQNDQRSGKNIMAFKLPQLAS
ncbi:MAG: response regulator [Deltaproteobacteria bacterium]|nr:response regulator [Deltaproteobacteria bacterium]